MDSARLYSLVAGLFFLALSAWLGCGLYQRASAPELMEVSYVQVEERAELEGLVLRWEQALELPWPGQVLAGDGERLSAGEAVALDLAGGETISPASALFFQERDGLEELSPALAMADPGPQALEAALDLRARKGRGARLVTGRDWYYWAFLPQGIELEVGEGCSLLFQGLDRAMEAKVWALCPAAGGGGTVLLRLTAEDKEALSLRKCRAELIYGSHSGAYLPEEAVHEGENGEKYVFILSSGLAKQVPVDIIYTGGGYRLAREGRGPEALSRGSTLILGEDIYEGKVLIW